jgi:hypothetical protein
MQSNLNVHMARAHSQQRKPPPVCFAAFAASSASRNVCPAGFLRLGTADACASAAAVAVEEYGGSGTYSYYPAGCFWHTASGRFYYNTNTTGAANYYAQPLCAGAAPPLRTRYVSGVVDGIRTRVRVRRGSPRLGLTVRVCACVRARVRASAHPCLCKLGRELARA